MKKILEISAAEGGKDSQLFTQDLASAYLALSASKNWTAQVLKNSTHKVQIEITGKNLQCLMHEAGGHRIQRVPPTESRGRVHTSTVTVSVTDTSMQNSSKYIMRDDDHFRVEWFSGTGKGGQHKNKHANCARIIHTPTGLKQEQQGRKRESNKREAMRLLLQLLDEKAQQIQHDKHSKIMKKQKGTGMRGDKIRTYRFQDDIVVDHQTGKKATVKKVMKGKFDNLWN